MKQVHVIRHKVLVEEKSVRSVAKEMGISRNTVAKYLTVSEPNRGAPRNKPSPVTEEVAPRIEQILEEWKSRTTPKQRITGSRVHRQLVEEGYQVGTTTIRDYLRERRRQKSEVFVPLVHRPGEEAQVDFFEVTVEEDGEQKKAWKFVMRLMYSGKDFLRVYSNADQLSFLDAHVRAFAYLGGVPERIVYDNLSAAVKKIIGGSDRELTERFRALVSHYLFEPCFTRPGEGHDKGAVEARGKGIRLAHLTPVPCGVSLAEISEDLLGEVERAFTSESLFAEEFGRLRGLPERPFEARKVELVNVSRRAMVKVEGTSYSVPSAWASLRATAYIGIEDIRIHCCGQTESFVRERKGTQKVRYRHYLTELSRKPQAVRQVAPELLEELGEPYEALWSMLTERYGEKEASSILARILGVILDHGEDPVSQALATALAQGRTDLLALSDYLADRSEKKASVAVPESLSGYSIEAANPADYDRLLSEGRGGAA